MHWTYEKLDENGKMKYLPAHDFDGKITGKIILGVALYFDENPEEARRLGWTKHIHHDAKEIREMVDFNPQTQNLLTSQKQIDEFTIEDTYDVIDKTEKQMEYEEIFEAVGLFTYERVVQIDDAGGVIAG